MAESQQNQPQFHYAAPAEPAPAGGKRAAPSKTGAVLWGLCFAFFFCAFCALGTWQVKRLGWKEHLIAAVNANTHLPPIEAPLKADWAKIGADAAAYNYRAVRVEGHFLPQKPILARASVQLSALDQTGGAGFWVMAPLARPDGSIVFINRGFIPLEQKDSPAAGAPPGEAQISGLLRLSEGPGHLFTRNDPQNHQWYNRDVPAFAAALGLPAGKVAPYFIDADKAPNAGGWPRGGLTVVQFPNNHLVYAITWFSGAFGTLIAAYLLFRARREPAPKAST